MSLDQICATYPKELLEGILVQTLGYALSYYQEELREGKAKLFVGEAPLELSLPEGKIDMHDDEEVLSSLGKEGWKWILEAFHKGFPIYIAASPDSHQPIYVVYRAGRSWPQDLEQLSLDLQNPLQVVINIFRALSDFYYFKRPRSLYEPLEMAIDDLFDEVYFYMAGDLDFHSVQRYLEILGATSPAYALVLGEILKRLPEWVHQDQG